MNRAGILIVAMLLLWAGAARAADTVYYYSSDTIHSEVVITDASRNVVERTYYAPYGAVLNRDLRDGPGYTGHEEDPETNLVYMQQRYYDPEAGRFLSTDPVQADGNGGSFNRYAYAGDNPYSYYDPDGRMKDQDQERSPGCTGSLTPGGCGAVNMSSFIVDNSYRRGNAPPQQQGLSSKSDKAIDKAAKEYGYDASAFKDAMTQAGSKYSLNPNLLAGLGMRESSLNPSDLNGGLFQIQDPKAYGIDPKYIGSFEVQIPAAAAFLSGNISHFNGNVDLGIAAWTLGRGGASRFFDKGGMPAVRDALLSTKHPDYGTVGSYIDFIKSF